MRPGGRRALRRRMPGRLADSSGLPGRRPKKESGMFEMEKAAKAIRVLTVAPVMALLLLSVLFFGAGESFGGLSDYLLAVLFLVVLPVAAYPAQPFIPKFRDMGRDGQRRLAMLAAVIGYLLGIAAAAILGTSPVLWTVYLTYLFSGVILMALNKLLKVKASGHACGVAGPVAILIYYIGWPALLGLLLLGLVYWSSLRMKRHTLPQLLLGTLVPLLSFACALWLSGKLRLA